MRLKIGKAWISARDYREWLGGCASLADPPLPLRGRLWSATVDAPEAPAFVEAPDDEQAARLARKRAEFPEGSQAIYNRPAALRHGSVVTVGAQGEHVPEAVFVRFADGLELFVGWEDLTHAAP